MVYQVHKWEIPTIWKGSLIGLTFVWLLDGAGWAGWMRIAVSFLMKPPLSLASQVVAREERTVRYLTQLSRAGRGNLDLVRQVEELRVQADKVALLEQENRELRQLMKLDEKKVEPGISGRVVLANGGQIRAWFEQRVAKGSLVIGNGRVIGLVDQEGANWAQIKPIGVGEAQLMIRTVAEPHPLGKLVKQGGELVVERVPKETNIPTGSLVVTVGKDQQIIPDIPVGTIMSVTTSPESVYQTLKLLPASELAVGDLVIALKGGE